MLGSARRPRPVAREFTRDQLFFFGRQPAGALRRDNVRIVPLESPTPVRSPGLLWRGDETRSPAARAFASIIRTVSSGEGRDKRRRRNRKLAPENASSSA
jgi:LysR family cyn operon transcriptional activator